MVDNRNDPSGKGDGDRILQRPGLIDRLRQALGLQSSSIREDIEEALEDAQHPGDDFSPQERAILRNVLGLHEHRVRDIMIPRADIVAIGIKSSLSEVLSLFRTAGHSRLPVHGDTLDDARGMVHIRDVVDYLANRAREISRRRDKSAEAEIAQEPADESLPRFVSPDMIDLSISLAATGIVRPVLFVPPSMPALDLLVRMQATRTHMALVIDEYGGTDGLVSIEDVVEMIVGDIEDEHDDVETPPIVKTSEGQFIVDGRAALADITEITGWDLPLVGDHPDVDTIGGLVTSFVGRVPSRGEIISRGTSPVEFEILDADPRRVKSIRLRRRPDVDQTLAGAQEPRADARAIP
jgi:CBS domain containing-hemolysin-like protein